MSAAPAATISGLIARFALDLRLADLPDEVLAAARRSILDVLAVTVAGSHSSTSISARRALLAADSTGAATVFGTAATAPPGQAALLNGIAAHALDYDDVWADDDGVVAWRGHPSVCVLPAVLAAAETAGGSGAEVLAAYVVGAEVAGKLGTAFGPELGRLGFHPTVILGTIGAAAGAARVLGLDPARAAMALGLAATSAAGLHRNFGTDTKPFHAGQAARCGLEAALLAGAGFTANPAALSDYLTVHGGREEAALAELASLGAAFDLVQPGLSIKKYPCCRFAHLPIDALLEVRSRLPVDAGAIQRITVRIQPGADDALNCPVPATGLEARFSMGYLLAAAAQDGAVTLGSVTDPQVQRPPVRELMARVVIEYRDEPGAEVVLTTGRTELSGRALIVRGDPANPMTAAEELAKCTDCVDPITAPGRSLELAGAVAGLARLASIAELTDLLRAPARAAVSPAGAGGASPGR